MNETALAAREALWISLQIGGPLLVLMLAVGLVIALLQALTQVNEATLAFLPKVVVLAGALLVLGPFFIGVLRGYAGGLFQAMVDLGQRG
ncbi:flagellar biosynthetic protein FliQ [Roseomonas sp. HJA6]|uniref:Flagellar biosynthetic protein FliQ n=1 Tax=Roseomonas alba TaxID=2846776 RepID=A0ABS7A4S6_9PROT|nr:flagellar biosynthetic protein FliQ [Neoroseomonas alba]MBW6397304.1 flagellar biosynthetic protein FliQ [Neoroseomonas alba]